MTKICTDIKQSKKLIELGIDINTADMWYQYIGDSFKDGITKPIYFPMVMRDDPTEKDVPAWSLSNLMKLLPSEFTEVGKYVTTTYKLDIRKFKLTDGVDLYQIAYGNRKVHEDGNSSWKDMINTGQKEELTDAVFAMVCWLLENKKI